VKSAVRRAPAHAAPGSRRVRTWLAALAAAVVLLGTLAALIAYLTPWTPLPGPIPGGRIAPDPHRTFSAAQIARQAAFHHAVRLPADLSFGLGILTYLLLGFTPLGARLTTRLAKPLGGHWTWRAVLGGIAITVAARIVTIGFDAWAHTIDRSYGLSTQGFPAWGLDQLRSLGVTLVPTVLLLLAFYAIARRLPRGWWAPVAAGGAALVIAGSFVYPLVVEPIFNDFHPLPQGRLRASLVAEAHASGIGVDDVLVADASRRTTAENAYVSGFGSTRRIVLYDTLLRKASPAQIRLLVGHELGHASNHDVLHGTIEGAVGVAAGLCLLFLALSWRGLRRVAGANADGSSGIRQSGAAGGGLGDARSVALVLAVVTVLSVLAGPLQNTISRRIEARADVHALRLTHDPVLFVRAQHQLAVQGLSDLDPPDWAYAWFATHPTPPQRIALGLDWRRKHPHAKPRCFITVPADAHACAGKSRR
jgi:STE24 endopeptidase